MPQIKALFQQLKGVSKEVGDQTASAAKAAGSVLVDQFGVPIKKVGAELKALAQDESKAASGARDLGKAASEMAGQTERVAGAAARAGRALRGMGEDGKSGANGAGAGLKGAAGHADSFGDSVGALARKLGLAYAGLLLFRQAVAFVKEGLDFGSKMETAQLGIGSLIAAQAKLTDATGRELKGREALNAALALSADQMQKLKIAGLETVATTEQLVVAYQQAVGVGLSVGMNLDQIREVTIKITQAAAALGLPMNQLSEEVRDLLQGNINPRNTRIATALQITNEEVRKWKAAGGSTLADELNTRMEAFGLAGENAAKTWQGVTSNVVEATQTLAGEMTKPLFTQLRDGLQGALEGVFDLKKAKISDEFTGLVEAGQEAFAGLGSLGTDAIQGLMGGLKEAAAWLHEHKILVQEIITNGVELVRTVFTLLGTLKEVASSMLTAEQRGNVISFIFKGLALVVAGISDGIRLIASGIFGLGTVILTQMVKPLQTFLEKLAQGLDLVGKGEWAAKLRSWSMDLQGMVDASAAKTAKMFDPLANGTGAVGTLLKAWENVNQVQDSGEIKRQLTHKQAVKRITELRDEIGKLEKAQAAALNAGGKNGDLAPDVQKRATQLAAMRKEREEVAKAAGITLQARNVPETKEKSNTYAQEMLRLEKEGLQYAGKATLEEERQLKVKELGIQREKDLDDVRKKAIKEGWSSEMTKSSREKIEQNYADGRMAVWDKYTKDRAKLEEDLQARLTAQEDGGLTKRLESVRNYIRDLRERNERSKAGGESFLTEDQIITAEAAMIARERVKQVHADVAEINKMLAERGQLLGRGLNDKEIDEVIAPFEQAGGTKGEAAGKVKKGLHRGESGADGLDAGIQGWLAQSRNAFKVWENFATSVLGGLESNFGSFFTSLTQRGTTFGEKTKALWSGISQTIVGAFGKIAAAELVDWGIKRAKLAWTVIASAWQSKDTAKTVAENTVKTTSNTTTAASGFFASLAALPFGAGFAIAAALVFAMMGLLKSITGRKVGGLAGEHGPELTLLGEEGLEVVAPEKDFKDWARNLIGMGSRLQANITSQEREVRVYQRQGIDYAQAAAEAPQGNESGRRPGSLGGDYYDLRGSFNVDPGSRQWADLVQSGIKGGGRSVG